MSYLDRLKELEQSGQLPEVRPVSAPPGDTVEALRQEESLEKDREISGISEISQSQLQNRPSEVHTYLRNKSQSVQVSNSVTDQLLSRLQAGSRWLTAQHRAWMDAAPDAASDERFSVALATWDEMERSLRLVFGYEGCVMGPDQHCPEDGLVVCDACRGASSVGQRWSHGL
ncbi:MAG: hypothetical protein ACE5Q6_05320 [Dehalococcoidia bacterium]